MRTWHVLAIYTVMALAVAVAYTVREWRKVGERDFGDAAFGLFFGWVWPVTLAALLVYWLARVMDKALQNQRGNK